MYFSRKFIVLPPEPSDSVSNIIVSESVEAIPIRQPGVSSVTAAVATPRIDAVLDRFRVAALNNTAQSVRVSGSQSDINSDDNTPAAVSADTQHDRVAHYAVRLPRAYI